MKIFFSKATRGFYNSGEPFTVLPPDAQALPAQDYAELIDGQAAGRLIDWSGLRPALIDMPTPTAEQVQADRRAAYRLESDPLKVEAEYDGQVNGTEPDYSAWLAKVAEIKQRYPLPE